MRKTGKNKLSKITQTVLKKYLIQCSNEELMADIFDLFNRLEGVKEYYQLKLAGNEGEAQVLEKYKAIVKKEFFPARGFGDARLSVARKAVMDYKKLSSSPEGLADLMLFYVEQGVAYTNEYGDITEAFYSSMESMYEKALQHLVKYHLENQFEERCRAVVKNTSGIGWGFHDTLGGMYDEYFDEDE